MKLQFALFEDDRRACVRRARLQRRIHHGAAWLFAILLAVGAGATLALSIYALFSP